MICEFLIFPFCAIYAISIRFAEKTKQLQVISHLFPYFCDNTPKILSYNLFEDELKNSKASMKHRSTISDN
ncbi:hypothetical protein BG32_07955 [Mesotoga sp. HF07.pep.5.2.highcov]|nr:hypothetical protein Y696_03430 [Mesotoga sp. H07pep.5.4]RLL89430.1 hypothetical protein BG32_07955 [Mesotoga sp. HF07.pep.5.2.highcov]